jgi:hypothetical protein
MKWYVDNVVDVLKYRKDNKGKGKSRTLKILEAKKKIPSIMSSGILSITLDNGDVVSLQDHSYFQKAWIRLSGKEYIAMEKEFYEKVEKAFQKVKG